MLNINLFGGPGTGKSTTAASIFSKLKKAGHKAEYVPEYAKDLTYSNETLRLSDSFLVIAEQHHRQYRINNQVDFIVHDSPFILGIEYVDDAVFNKELFTKFILDTFHRYDNLNIFLKRNVDEHPYHEYGRKQSLEEAIEIDNKLKNMLRDNGISFYEIEISDHVEEDIIKFVDSAMVQKYSNDTKQVCDPIEIHLPDDIMEKMNSSRILPTYIKAINLHPKVSRCENCDAEPFCGVNNFKCNSYDRVDKTDVVYKICEYPLF